MWVHLLCRLVHVFVVCLRRELAGQRACLPCLYLLAHLHASLPLTLLPPSFDLFFVCQSQPFVLRASEFLCFPGIPLSLPPPQVAKLQTALDEAGPWQERLESQLASAQQLVRGSLLQHQKYEATIEEQGDQIASLTRDKERLEREVASLRQQDRALPGGDAGAHTLEQLLDMERRRFKTALADERMRFAEAQEREQVGQCLTSSLDSLHSASQPTTPQRQSNTDWH